VRGPTSSPAKNLAGKSKRSSLPASRRIKLKPALPLILAFSPAEKDRRQGEGNDPWNGYEKVDTKDVLIE
jgi:hypothetical protein